MPYASDQPRNMETILVVHSFGERPFSKRSGGSGGCLADSSAWFGSVLFGVDRERARLVALVAFYLVDSFIE